MAGRVGAKAEPKGTMSLKNFSPALCAGCLDRYYSSECDEPVAFLIALNPDVLALWISSKGHVGVLVPVALAPASGVVCLYCGRTATARLTTS